MHVKEPPHARTVVGPFQLIMRISAADNHDISPLVRAALDHPCRQRILRSLRDTDGPMSAAEIRAGGRASCTLSCVTYHLGVLVEADLVRRLGAESVRGRLEHKFATTQT
jgi:hypothetical protein